MRKCEVIAPRLSLVCGKGSVVMVDDRQFEVAKQFLKPIVERETVRTSESLSDFVEEKPKPKRKKKSE